jgi:hypothetical protein
VPQRIAESEFWLGLEYRISRELEGFSDPGLRYLGCDGLEPLVFHLNDGMQPHIAGRAYCGHSGQEEWTFLLLLPPGTAHSRDRIDWTSLLPPEDVTEWLTPHPREKRLVIDPGAAVPDELSTGSN